VVSAVSSLLCYAGYGAGLVAAGYAALIAVSDSDTTTALSREQASYYAERVVWITGASAGIGLQLATHIARLNQPGTRLVLTARTRSKLEAAKAQLEALGSNVRVGIVACDVGQLDALPAAFAAAEQLFGRIDILDNAGLSQRGAALQTSFAVDEELVRVDLLSCMLLAKLVLPGMTARKFGHIVNVGSMAGQMGVVCRTAYCAAKWGLRGYSDALRYEQLGSASNVAVTLLSPAYVKTDISLNAHRGDGQKLAYTDKNIANGMSVERAAALMSRAITNRLPHSWIIGQALPKLAGYAVQYAPWLLEFLMKFMAAKLMKREVEEDKRAN
jgi:short-subunit dehydrogenase